MTTDECIQNGMEPWGGIWRVEGGLAEWREREQDCRMYAPCYHVFRLNYDKVQSFNRYHAETLKISRQAVAPRL
jgi:hypothetical protein